MSHVFLTTFSAINHKNFHTDIFNIQQGFKKASFGSLSLAQCAKKGQKYEPSSRTTVISARCHVFTVFSCQIQGYHTTNYKNTFIFLQIWFIPKSYLFIIKFCYIQKIFLFLQTNDFFFWNFCWKNFKILLKLYDLATLTIILKSTLFISYIF